MPLSPFVVDRFSGLNVYEDPQEIGAASAVDLLNVDLDKRGRVRSRDGSSALTAAAANRQAGMSYFTSGVGGLEQIVAVESSTLTPYTLSDGSAVGSTQAVLAPPTNLGFARFGDTSNQRLYVAGGALYRWTGAAWSTIGSVPISPKFAAVTPNDNRLAITDGTTIHFSDAGAPETFGANNFVTLWPGDGEGIMGLVRWRDYLFAFKRTKFAVFTGTGTDADGEPVFNYRSVDGGRGAYAEGQAVAGEEGVYFVDATGVYVTAGDTPRYISRALEPWLRSGSSGSLPSFSLTTAVLAYHDRRLYVMYPNTTSSTTLVYDPALDSWMVWQMGAVGGCSVPVSSQYRGLYFGEYTSKKIAKVDASVATDLGSAFSWSYTSGAYDVSGNNRVAVSLESALWGTGSVTLKVANDHGSFDTGSAVSLGTSPAVAQTFQQVDREGTYWQHKLSGTTAATVHRLAHYLSFVKPAGVG